MRLIDHKQVFRNLNEMSGRNAECYADVVLPKFR